MRKLRPVKRGGVRRSPASTGIVPSAQNVKPKNAMNRLQINKGGVSAIGVSPQSIKEFNSDGKQVYTQSFRITLNTGKTTFKPVLAGSGLLLKGIAITTQTTTSIADTQLNFAVNNRNILVDASALLFVPNYTLNKEVYYPTPQPLTGKDTFQFDFQKNDAGSVVVMATLVYVPAY